MLQDLLLLGLIVVTCLAMIILIILARVGWEYLKTPTEKSLTVVLVSVAMLSLLYTIIELVHLM